MLSPHYLESWSVSTKSGAGESLLCSLLRFPGGCGDSWGWNFNASTTSCGGCGETFGPSLNFQAGVASPCFLSPLRWGLLLKWLDLRPPPLSFPLFACVCLQTSVDAEPLKLHGRVTPANDEERMAHRKQPSTPHLLHRGSAGIALPNAHFSLSPHHPFFFFLSVSLPGGV